MVMKLLRKRMKIVIWIAATAFIALIFLAWGMDITKRGPGGMLSRGFVANVNGKIVRIETYRQALRNAFYNASVRGGDRIDPLESTLIEENVFEQLIQERVAGGRGQ